MDNSYLRMAMYSRALGVMGAHYSGPVSEKKADKDYDGDGKVESSKEEYFGSKDKAIKKAMGKKVEEEVQQVDEVLGASLIGGASGASQGKGVGGKVKKGIGGGAGAAVGTAVGGPIGGMIGSMVGSKVAEETEEEQMAITKEMVVEFLIDEKYANNEVSAEALFNHMSDEFLVEIEERIEAVSYTHLTLPTILLV